MTNTTAPRVETPPVAVLKVAGSLLLASFGVPASTASPPGSPTADEILRIEKTVKLPGDSNELREYVRYYYLSSQEPERIIQGIYVWNHYYPDMASGPLPRDPIVIVSSSDDVPAPYDAGCGVVWVRDYPAKPVAPHAECSPTLAIWPEPTIPGWMYGLIPLAPIGAFAWFVVSRWLQHRRARAAERRRDGEP